MTGPWAPGPVSSPPCVQAWSSDVPLPELGGRQVMTPQALGLCRFSPVPRRPAGSPEPKPGLSCSPSLSPFLSFCVFTSDYLCVSLTSLCLFFKPHPFTLQTLPFSMSYTPTPATPSPVLGLPETLCLSCSSVRNSPSRSLWLSHSLAPMVHLWLTF
uniref:Uncharacterized protein n=1 Tax=Rousettus aegyptiacus TaxID=9407 RepID=A0A7J8KAU2_ROUAE|nr:hypothetical protein HJG63_007828 [Rousettus aegyptiacus]